jgi:hypothetical protein
MVIDRDIADTNERVAKLEAQMEAHEERHTREAQEAEKTLKLAVSNEVALSAASTSPISAVLKWVAGLVAAGIAALFVWLSKR